MKSVKNVCGVLILGITCFLLLCTIKDDNGGLVATGPHTTTTPTTTTVIAPVLIVTPDSMYVGIGESLTVTITVMRDSTLTKPLTNTRVICEKTRGFLSAETLLTDVRGRAELKMMDTVKGRVEIRVICGTTEQVLQIDVTDTPDKVQKRIQVTPEKPILKADGKDFTVIQVLLMNENNNPIVGQCVQFISSSGMIAGQGGSCGSSGQGATDNSGIARAILTSAAINDTAFITVFLVSDRTKTAQTKVVFKGVAILLHADTTNLKTGRSAAVTAILVNGSNEAIPYAPIFFTLSKDSGSNLSFVSKDTLTGPEGNAQCVIQGDKNGTDSIRVFAAGATATLRINVTELTLAISLDDKILQARETESTRLHVTFASNSGAPLAGKTVQLKRKYKQIDGKDTLDYILITTDSQGKCTFTINALPYDCDMMLEVTAFNTSVDIASATATLSFLTTRTMTVNAIPPVIQADGTSKSAITVQVKSELNNPIVGDQVKFTTDAGMVTSLATTDENGRAVGYLTSDRRNTVANVIGMLVKDPTKSVRVKVEFTGVELTASTNPPSINSGGKDTSMIDITLVDAAKNPIVGEPINFSVLQDKTHLVVLDSVTNNRGEAHAKIFGTGSGIDTIKIGAAGASTKVAINYSSNYLRIDTVPGQTCIANGKDSTQLTITYREGDSITPIPNADIEVSTLTRLQTASSRCI